jgi:peptidyl-prolyl cis-trans isomerase C
MEWRASHILVKDRSAAGDILKRIKQGAAFESLAREFSTCPSKSSGGDLGWFGPGKMVAQFESAVKGMSVGSVSDVVQTQFGYHLIKCTGRKD